MTVAVNDTIERYLIAGVGPYAYSWRIFNTTDLQVYALSTASPPVPTLLTNISDYTVTGANVSSGGSITLSALAAATYAGYTLDIRSNTPEDQPTSIRNTARFLPEIHEDAYDYLSRQIQDLRRLVNESIRVPDNELPLAMIVPPLATRLGKFGAYDPLGQPIASVGTGNDSALRTDLASSVFGAEGSKLVGTRRTAAGVSKRVWDVLYRDNRVEDFGNNAVPGTTDIQLAFQTAIDTADLYIPRVRLSHQNAIGKPLLVKPASVQNLWLDGEGRTVSTIEPTAIDIKQPAQNVNCLIFNQADNGHLHLTHLRFFSDLAYTGQILYCVEGGGADLSGQALYSAVFDDLWLSLSSQNTGYFRGGLSNLKANNLVVESVKDAVFILEGGGNGDQIHQNIQMFICFDNYIRASDGNVKAAIQVLGLNCYSHLRGRLIEINNGRGCFFTNILMEPDAANLGDCGLFKFTDCTNTLAIGFSLAARAGVPAGALGIDLINGNTGKFAHGRINATVGLKFSGAGVVDLEFEDVDFTGCTDCLSINGTLSGRVRFTRCKFNDSQLRGIVHATGTPTIAWEFDLCEVLNAGLGGAAGRNVDLSLPVGASAVFRQCRIGQNTGLALAAYYVSNGNALTIPRFIDCDWIGAAPTGLTDAITANLPFFKFRPGIGTAVASAANITLPFDGDQIVITGAVGITGITAGGWKGNKITLIFTGNLTVTDGSNLKLAGNFVSGAGGFSTLSLVNFDNTNWCEAGRAVN